MKKKYPILQKSFSRFFLPVCFFLCSNLIYAATITSNAVTGNWSNTASWVGGVVPGAADNAVIVNGATISVDQNYSITSVTVNTGGYLKTAGAGGGKALTVSGTFTIQGGGTYEHNNSQTASTTIFAGTESFAATSTIIINNWSGTGTSIITGCSSNFGNLTLNWGTGAFYWVNEGLGFTRTIQGNFTVAAGCDIILNQVGGNITITVGGNLNLSDNLVCKYNIAGNVTLNVGGSTTISNTIFRGIYLDFGVFTMTTASFNMTSGAFHCVEPGSPGACDVSFTSSGAFSISGGQFIGVDAPYTGNSGIITFNVNSFTLTAGSVILHSADVTDGRTCSMTVTNNMSLTYGSGSDFFEFNNISNFASNTAIYTLNVGGNLSCSGSTSGLLNTRWTNAGADNVFITGNMTLSGGMTSFAGGIPGNMPNNTLTCTIGGNVSITGAAAFYSQSSNNTSKITLNVGTASINWTQTTTGTVSLTNVDIPAAKIVTLAGNKMGDMQAGRTCSVLNGAQLWCSNYPVTGAGLFTLNTGALLGIGSIAGITSAGATGNIQVTGTRTYNSIATYEYYQGLTPQATGNFTTTSTSGTYPCQISSLIINKSLATNIVNLTNTTDITGGGGGTLTLTMGILTTSYTAATAPWVRISTGALVSPVGGSANSYVDGYIRKQGNTSFIFPTGNSSRWRRIEMTAPSIATEFEARYIYSAYANTTSMAGAPATVLNHVSLNEYWYLSKPLGADAATAKVKLYWEDASTSGILKFDSLAVGRWNGAAWENTNCYVSCPANWTSSTPERTYTGSATGTNLGTIQSNTVSSFSPFTFASIGAFAPNPLPIELVSFSGYYNDFLNVLNWTTASETNNDYFTVERTFDGVNFEEVKRIPGAGNSTGTLNYSITDDKQYSGIAYYRLKQTDYNGQFKYSSLISISHENANHVSVLPNPVSGSDLTLNFSCSNDGNCQVNVIDITGKLISSRDYAGVTGANTMHLDVAELSSGIYFITILKGNDLDKIKFIKE